MKKTVKLKPISSAFRNRINLAHSKTKVLYNTRKLYLEKSIAFNKAKIELADATICMQQIQLEALNARLSRL